MTLTELKTQIETASIPAQSPLAIRALCFDAKGDWNKAHHLAQQGEGQPACDWVHAYLHRKEGDIGNAGYWYRRAGRQISTKPLAVEWDEIAEALLSEETK